MLEINRTFVRVAGIMGATAVVLGAYGAHVLYNKQDITEHTKRVFETASRYHFYHSLALILAPFSRFPKTTGSLMVSGMILFCGTCYYESFTGDAYLRKFTPVGGSLLILSWLFLVL